MKSLCMVSDMKMYEDKKKSFNETTSYTQKIPTNHISNPEDHGCVLETAKYQNIFLHPLQLQFFHSPPLDPGTREVRAEEHARADSQPAPQLHHSRCWLSSSSADRAPEKQKTLFFPV